MKQFPTLADHLLKSSYDKKGRAMFKPALREALTNARRYVLDEDMSGFLADLGYQAFVPKDRGIFFPESTDLTDPAALDALLKRAEAADKAKLRDMQTRNMDSARRLARIPHPVMWIEWDEIALATRAQRVYGSEMDPMKVPFRSGWLIIRHPTIDTMARAICFGEGSNFQHADDGGIMVPARRDDGEREMGVSPFAFAWSSTDDPTPWKFMPAAVDMSKTRGISQGAMATGLIDYDSNLINFVECRDMFADYVCDQSDANMRVQLQEQFGLCRYLLSFIAVINDLPVAFKEVRPAKGFVARGNYKRFLTHQTITLTVPTKRYAALARRALTILRRKAHEVKGHWRNDWRKMGSDSCAHVWDSSEAGHLNCSACGKRKVWIPEHQRGDATLGFVHHDYRVTTGADNA